MMGYRFMAIHISFIVQAKVFTRCSILATEGVKRRPHPI
jgi:hypothetical protein